MTDQEITFLLQAKDQASATLGAVRAEVGALGKATEEAAAQLATLNNATTQSDGALRGLQSEADRTGARIAALTAMARDLSQQLGIAIPGVSSDLMFSAEQTQQTGRAGSPLLDRFTSNAMPQLDELGQAGLPFSLLAAAQNTDELTRAQQAAAAASGSLEGRLGALIGNLGNAGSGMRSFAGEAQQMGWAMSFGLTVPIVAAGDAIIKTAADFETGMSRIAGLTDAGVAATRQFEPAVRELSTQLPQSAADLAKGLYIITSAGMTGDEAMAALTASAKAAAAGLGDTVTVADAVTSVLKAYGESGAQAGAVTDILVETVARGKMPADQLASALGRVLPIAAAAGVSFAQVAASIATMTHVGLSSDEAVTALRGTLAALTNPGAQAKKALDGIGLSADDLRKEIADKGLLATLADLMARTGGNVDTLELIVPNIRALTGVLATAGSQAGYYAATLDAMSSAQGRANQAFDVASKTFNFQASELRNKFAAVMIEIGDAVLPRLEPVMAMIGDDLPGAFQTLKDVIAELPPGSAAMVAALLAILAAAGPAAIAVSAVAFAVTGLLNPLGLAAGAVALFGAAYVTNFAGVRDATNQTASEADDALTGWGDLLGWLGTQASTATREVQGLVDALPTTQQSKTAVPGLPSIQLPGAADLAVKSVELTSGLLPLIALGRDLKSAFDRLNPSVASSAVDLQTYDDAIATVGTTTEAALAGLDALPSPLAAAGASAEGAAASMQDLQAALSGLGGIDALISGLVDADPAAQAAQARIDALQGSVRGLQAAQEANSAATSNAQDALRGLQDQATSLNTALAAAKQKLSDLTHPELTGMTAMDNRIFALQQRIKALDIRKLQMDQGATTTHLASGRTAKNPAMDAIDAEQKRLQDQLQILQDQKGLRFDPQLRKLQQDLTGPTKELSFGDAEKQIKDTKGSIADLESQLASNKDATRAQQDAIRGLEDAGKGLSSQLKVTNSDLSDAQKAHTAVVDALKQEYDWTLKQAPALEKLGGVYADVVGLIGDRMTTVNAALQTFVANENDATKQGLDNALKDLQSAMQREREILSGTLPADEAASVFSPHARHPALGGFASGGSFIVGGRGGTDSQLVAFMATPGEHVSVGPGGATGGVARVHVDVNLNGDVRVTSSGDAGADDLGARIGKAFREAVHEVARGKINLPNTARPLRAGAL